jgi:hypothetical protein
MVQKILVFLTISEGVTTLSRPMRVEQKLMVWSPL